MPTWRLRPTRSADVRLRHAYMAAAAGSALAFMPAAMYAQETSAPQPHHVGRNTVDVERAVASYLGAWPAARRTTVAGLTAVDGDMFLIFHEVDAPPDGAYSEKAHRSEPQSAFWHIGAFSNTTDMKERLGTFGITHKPLFTSPDDTVGVWRSGLAPVPGGAR